MAEPAKRNETFRTTLVGMMAAIAFVSNYIRIPFLDSQIHIGNAVCALCGLMLGPGAGALAAGMGNLLFDLLAGWGAECVITFVNKGAVALVAGAIAAKAVRGETMTRWARMRMLAGCALGALAYTALYMLKTFLFGLTINGLTLDATLIKMAGKLPASLINAGFATIAAPILMHGLRPAMRRMGLFERMG